MTWTGPPVASNGSCCCDSDCTLVSTYCVHVPAGGFNLGGYVVFNNLTVRLEDYPEGGNFCDKQAFFWSGVGVSGGADAGVNLHTIGTVGPASLTFIILFGPPLPGDVPTYTCAAFDPAAPSNVFTKYAGDGPATLTVTLAPCTPPTGCGAEFCLDGLDSGPSDDPFIPPAGAWPRLAMAPSFAGTGPGPVGGRWFSSELGPALAGVHVVFALSDDDPTTDLVIGIPGHYATYRGGVTCDGGALAFVYATVPSDVWPASLTLTPGPCGESSSGPAASCDFGPCEAVANTYRTSAADTSCAEAAGPNDLVLGGEGAVDGCTWFVTLSGTLTGVRLFYDPSGGSGAGWYLLYESGGSPTGILYFCAATDFACLGSSTFTLVGTPLFCGAWPPAVTVEAV